MPARRLPVALVQTETSQRAERSRRVIDRVDLAADGQGPFIERPRLRPIAAVRGKVTTVRGHEQDQLWVAQLLGDLQGAVRARAQAGIVCARTIQDGEIVEGVGKRVE